MENYIENNSSPHVIHRASPRDYNSMRATPDRAQPPQASASTNSATRAFCCQLDGVSQENNASSSVADGGLEFLAPEFVLEGRAGCVENQITETGEVRSEG
jgi:hypothetical protein